MEIIQTYKYEKDEIIYVGRPLPEGVEPLETMDILVATKGYDLVRISDKENIGKNVWLKDGDKQENYIEVERPERIRPNADR